MFSKLNIKFLTLKRRTTTRFYIYKLDKEYIQTNLIKQHVRKNIFTKKVKWAQVNVNFIMI